MNIRPLHPCFTEGPPHRKKTPSTPFIDRRHFLRGLGMALALPAFESLNVGFAATAPKADPRRLLCIGNHLGFWPEGFFPTTDGRGWKITIDRGLDIFQRFDAGAFSLEQAMQELRLTRGAEVNYVKL